MSKEGNSQIENNQNYEDIENRRLNNVVRPTILQRVIGFFRTELGFFILVFVALRLMFIFLPMNPYDYFVGYQEGRFVAEGNMVYRDVYALDPAETVIGRHLHPPLHYYYLGLVMFLAGEDYMLGMYFLKIVMVLSELFMLVYIYKLLLIYYPQKKAYNITLIWTTNPFLIFLISYAGIDEIRTGILMLLSFYYFNKQRPILSALFLSMGIQFTIYPVVFLLPYAITFLHKKHFKELIQYVIYVSLFTILGCLPALISDPPSFFIFIGRLTTYKTNLVSLPEPIKSILNYSMFTIDLGLFNIEIRFKTFVQISSALLFALYLFFDSKRKEYLSINDQLLMIIKTLIFAIIITISIHFRLFLWLTPYLIVYIYSNNKKVEDFDDIALRSLIKRVSILTWIVFGVILSGHIMFDIQFLGLEQIMHPKDYIDLYILPGIILIVYTLIYIYFLNTKLQDKNGIFIIILQMVYAFLNIISFWIG